MLFESLEFRTIVSILKFPFSSCSAEAVFFSIINDSLGVVSLYKDSGICTWFIEGKAEVARRPSHLKNMVWRKKITNCI